MLFIPWCHVPLAVAGDNDESEARPMCNEEPLQPPFNADDRRRWQAQAFVIDSIAIRVDDIFPRADTLWIAPWVNALHRRTRPSAIRQQLLVREGEVFDLAKIAESERVLRSLSYLYDADISVDSVCAGRVRLQVRVRDLWTLLPDINISQTGGDTRSRVGFRDSNFLGLGKQLVIVRKSDPDREGYSFDYFDPNLFGSRNTLRLGYTDNDDGESHTVSFQRPFYSLDSRRAAGLSHVVDERTDSLYMRNRRFQEFQHREKQVSLFAGFSPGQIRGRSQRLLLGYTRAEDEFAPTPDTRADEAFPADRNYRFPWIAWHLIEDQYAEARNFDLINRTEDINFGLDAFVRLGYSSREFEADDEGLLFEGFLSKVLQLDLAHLLSLNASLSGVDGDGGLQNFVSRFELRYHNSVLDRQQLFARLRLTRAHRLFADKQLLLGGDNGLRGYPSRYQSGDRSYMLTLEQRFYLQTEVMELFDVGAAVFADAGRAWFDDRDNGSNGGMLKNVGFGLRFSPTRSGKNVVLHLDFAFPIDNEDSEVDDFQINFEAKSRF